MKEIMAKRKTSRQWGSLSNMSEKEKVQLKVDTLNNSEGTLDKNVYDCEKCKNKGYIYSVIENDGHYSELAKECDCKAIRQSIISIRKSGLEPIIKKSTFERFETNEKWQQTVKEKAQIFANTVDHLENKCFFIGGGVGAGKTHLCTAIVGQMLSEKRTARYMLWVRDSAKLKMMVNDEAYEPELDDFRKVEVLYIDDFFKITKDGYGKETLPTSADIRLAYEIINYRYQHSELITIISSERFINEIEEIDSAVGSRIYEMSKGNVLNIAREKKRNYRLKDAEIL